MSRNLLSPFILYKSLFINNSRMRKRFVNRSWLLSQHSDVCRTRTETDLTFTTQPSLRPLCRDSKTIVTQMSDQSQIQSYHLLMCLVFHYNRVHSWDFFYFVLLPYRTLTPSPDTDFVTEIPLLFTPLWSYYSSSIFKLFGSFLVRSFSLIVDISETPYLFKATEFLNFPDIPRTDLLLPFFLPSSLQPLQPLD